MNLQHQSARQIGVPCINPKNIRAIKSVKFAYVPTPQTRELLGTFRTMVNDAIRISIDENIKGRLNLRNRIYKEFQERSGLVSCYPYSVSEVAWSIVKKFRRWKRRPFAKRLMMKMDSDNFSLNYSILSLPFKKGERILIPLLYGDYQRSFLMDPALKRGSITLTDSNVILVFSKDVRPLEPLSRIGLDLNEKSVVASDGNRWDLSDVARLHAEYGIRRSDFYRRHPHDNRVKKNYASSRRERERLRQLLHRAAKEVVKSAKNKKQAIVLEKLKGVRYLHRRGNGQWKGARRRISTWPFHILQSYITYKAKWVGVQVEFVSPAYTSRTCSRCLHTNNELKPTDREWRCPNCGAILDRDLNAAINIERRGKIPCLGVVRPGAQGTDEAMKGNPTTPVILRAEALKVEEVGRSLSSLTEPSSLVMIDQCVKRRFTGFYSFVKVAYDLSSLKASGDAGPVV